jgi:hypothetical protein
VQFRQQFVQDLVHGILGINIVQYHQPILVAPKPTEDQGKLLLFSLLHAPILETEDPSPAGSHRPSRLGQRRMKDVSIVRMDEEY